MPTGLKNLNHRLPFLTSVRFAGIKVKEKKPTQSNNICGWNSSSHLVFVHISCSTVESTVSVYQQTQGFTGCCATVPYVECPPDQLLSQIKRSRYPETIIKIGIRGVFKCVLSAKINLIKLHLCCPVFCSPQEAHLCIFYLSRSYQEVHKTFRYRFCIFTF